MVYTGDQIVIALFVALLFRLICACEANVQQPVKAGSQINLWPHLLTVRKAGFQPVNESSILSGVTK